MKRIQAQDENGNIFYVLEHEIGERYKRIEEKAPVQEEVEEKTPVEVEVQEEAPKPKRRGRKKKEA